MSGSVDQTLEVERPDSVSRSLRSNSTMVSRWLRECPSSADLGLYIHVPFCRSRCHFCAFYLLIHREDRVQRFLRALDEEIRWYAYEVGLADRPVSSVYLGGGTPTVLSPGQLAAMLNSVCREFVVCPDAEITVEAVPATLTADLLHELQYAGVTRLSVGGQSLQDTDRSRLGRKDPVEGIEQAVRLARALGLDNINVDVMYGIPGQTLDGWADTLSHLVELRPAHVSCYACTIEPHSRFGVDLRRGDLHEPDAVLQNCMEDLAEGVLTSAGYDRYELSNYARPGYACRHNLRYWTGQDYVGLGPSAQSYVNGVRFGNVADLTCYARELACGHPPVESVERLDPERRERERIVFGLRLLAGIELGDGHRSIRDRDWCDTLNRLIDHGWLRRTRTGLQLTKDGRRFADSIAVELL